MADAPLSADLRQRSGAHRPRRSPLRDLVPAVLVLAVVLAVGVGSWQLLPRSGGSGTSGGPLDAGADDPAATTTAAPTTTAPVTLPSPTAVTPTVTGSVDRAVPVSVLNGTTRSGLAAAAASTLRARSWTVTTGNGRARGLPTTVFYSAADLQATAQAVADDLGSPAVLERSTRYGADRVTVLLGDDVPG